MTHDESDYDKAVRLFGEIFETLAECGYECTVERRGTDWEARAWHPGRRELHVVKATSDGNAPVALVESIMERGGLSGTAG